MTLHTPTRILWNAPHTLLLDEDKLFVRKRAVDFRNDRILGYLPLNATEENLIDAFWDQMPGTFDLCRVNANGSPNYEQRDLTVTISEDHPHFSSFEAFVERLK